MSNDVDRNDQSNNDAKLDRKDKLEARKVLITLIALLFLLGIAVWLLLPEISSFAQTQLAPGLGLKSAAVIAFFITTVLMIIMAIASGDGLIGELPFMLGGFLLFYVIIWLSMAWIF